MSKQKMTVVIPTRERCDVFEQSLKTVTAQNYDNLDIIISDNFSGDRTRDIALSANDPRISYINTGERVSMSHNWEFALSHVKDGWVTIIGDDDGLLPGALEAVSEMSQDISVEAIVSRPCSYLWPSSTGHNYGRLIVPLKLGSEKRNSNYWLEKVMSGKAGYADLPMLYTGGWVKTAVLERLKGANKRIYQSSQPDVYSAIAIASVVNEYLWVDDALSMSGASEHSTGGSFGSHKEGDIKAASYRRFMTEGNIEFHRDIPLCADGSYPLSIQALVYEAFLKSEFLRPKNSSCIKDRQLELILVMAHESFRKEAPEWGAKFAEMHGLDFAKISAKSNRRLQYRPIQVLASLIHRAWQNYILFSKAVPIINVYEASVAAAVIKNIRPSHLQRVNRAVVRAIEKYIKKEKTH